MSVRPQIPGSHRPELREEGIVEHVVYDDSIHSSLPINKWHDGRPPEHGASSVNVCASMDTFVTTTKPAAARFSRCWRGDVVDDAAGASSPSSSSTWQTAMTV